jgi:hypothetical protein
MRYLRYALKGLHPRNFYYIASVSLGDFIKKRHPAFSNEVHLKAAMEWLALAQKQNKDGGVSALYSLFDGWSASYVETTGYIIPTFFNYAGISKNSAYSSMAIEMAEFELKSQLPSGAFPGGGTTEPRVFNTGQVIFGMCRAYEETKNKKYKESAERAADWLVSIMDKDGCWRKHVYLGNHHTYNTRTAWSLLRTYEITKKISYKRAAIKNFEWAMTQQLENGWFRNNGFYEGQEPLLHTIAYSIRGLLEGGIFLKRKSYIEAAKKASDALLRAERRDGLLAGTFNSKWKSSVKWSCLTGNCQMSIIWQKLYLLTKDRELLAAAKRINRYMKTTQNLASRCVGIKGGIQGAFPIYGWYAPFSFPNWAAKFFADSLMLEDNASLANKLS